MTLTQLEYLVAVATYHSFVAAAEKCFVTQPTLSMQIHKLEDEFGVKIFDRNKHPITTTEIGALIVQQAKIALSEAKKIDEIIAQNKKEIAGIFRFAIIPTIAPYILPQLLSDYLSKFPKLKLEIVEMQTNDIIRALVNNELDAALVSTPLENSDIKEYPLFYEPLVAYFSKKDKVLQKRMVNINDIQLQHLWLLNEGNCLRNQVLNLCSESIHKIQGEKGYKYESSNVDTLRKMVDLNGGVTIIPELATFELPEDAQDHIRYFEESEPVREISLVTNKHFVKMSILQTIMDVILAHIPEKMKVQKADRKVLRIQTAKL